MYKGHQASISSLKYSPDGLWIASGDTGGNVKVCILFALTQLLMFHFVFVFFFHNYCSVKSKYYGCIVINLFFFIFDRYGT